MKDKKPMKAPKAQGKANNPDMMPQRGNDTNAMYNKILGENASKLKKQLKKM
jgi:hypothetical protein